MTRIGFALFIIISLATVSSCVRKHERIAVESLPSPTVFYRFDEAFFACPSQELMPCLADLEEVFFPFFQAGDSLFWYRQRTDSLMLKLKQLVSERSEEVELALERSDNVLKRFEYFFPGSTPSFCYTYISPLDFDFPLFIADTLVFVALDQYLGPDADVYAGRPRYLNRGKSLQYLPLDLAEQLAIQQARRPHKPDELLSLMIYEGKLIYLANQLNPDAPTHQLLRYTEEEWNFCLENEANIWSYLIEQQQLFSAESDLRRRLIEPAPFCKFYLPIDNQTPGRLGRWVGYRIVSKRMEEGNMTLEQLMQATDARQFLRESRYKP